MIYYVETIKFYNLINFIVEWFNQLIDMVIDI